MRAGGAGRAVRAGDRRLAVVFLALVGMIEKFDDLRLVGDVITFA